MIIVLAVTAFFALMMLALWGGYSSIEESRRAKAPAPEVEEHSEAKCLLCNRPLPRSYTSDEVVSELEKRIDADTAMVVSYLRQPPAPEVLSRMYQA
ncbi:MAG: hypothetical protein ACYC8T_24390 [Myxococcaceae bacterium]